MAITVNDIRNKQFKMEGRGYNCDEVDDFLDALAEQTEKLIRENTGLKNELAAAKEQAEAAKAAEKTALEAVHARRPAGRAAGVQRAQLLQEP